MYRERTINIFILLPLIAALSGNPSLGLIVSGLTGLIWGTGSGSLFIGVTTTLLLIFTGNINMELIFLYALTLAYLIESCSIPVWQKRSTVYPSLIFFSLLLTPYWRQILGYIPVSLLNELNVAGGFLVIAGLLIFLLRFHFLLKSGSSREKILESLLAFICSLTGLMGSFLTILLWLDTRYLINVLVKYEWKFKSFLFQREILYLAMTIIIYLVTIYAANILLPYGFSTGLLLISIPFLFFRRVKVKELPALELAYFSMILGILASRAGILL